MQSTDLSKISDDILEIAAEIDFDLLLEEPITADHTIRYICNIHKALLNANPDSLNQDLARVERAVSRVYDRIGHQRRKLAFDRLQQPRQEAAQPVAEPAVPRVFAAEPLTLDRAAAHLRDFIQALTEEDAHTFVFAEAKNYVATAHLALDKAWSPEDSQLAKQRPRWESTVSSAMQKLRQEELVHYHTKQDRYHILTSITP